MLKKILFSLILLISFIQEGVATNVKIKAFVNDQRSRISQNFKS